MEQRAGELRTPHRRVYHNAKDTTNNKLAWEKQVGLHLLGGGGGEDSAE